MTMDTYLGRGEPLMFNYEIILYGFADGLTTQI